MTVEAMTLPSSGRHRGRAPVLVAPGVSRRLAGRSSDLPQLRIDGVVVVA